MAVLLLLLQSSAPVAQEPSPSKHAADDFPGFDKVVQRAAMNVDPRFSTSIHTNLIKNDSRAARCTEILARAQWRQDILAALVPSAHFDNCEYESSRRYILARMTEARAFGKRGATDEALAALGRALHGIQDFYSHTNYVELAANRHPSFSKVPIVQLWKDDGGEQLRSLVAGGLRSGYVWWELPLDACGTNRETHEQLSKDTASSARGKQIIKAWSLTHHQAARDLARQATNEFLRDALRSAELRSVASSCNNKVGYLLLTDNRKDAR